MVAIAWWMFVIASSMAIASNLWDGIVAARMEGIAP
jgi:hypothetical protein